MADQRRWSSAEFHRHLVGHPLLWHVARRLLWVTSEGPDGGEACFRSSCSGRAPRAGSGSCCR
ncbi:DUF4132 domain-containing protein [Dactylosporangium sp. NPDC050588]|uniref:DUF4132 domain-containing protein n=1 Tax=Dactylosporangium sp. NPDC050588 TaxID=3157211 RepID=UPI0033BFF527